MFFVKLAFAGDRSRAGHHMEGHKAWIQRGFDDGVFLMVGSLEPGVGGGILAHGTSRTDLEDRLAEDPFVAEEIVTTEILELSPARADERLAFLLA